MLQKSDAVRPHTDGAYWGDDDGGPDLEKYIGIVRRRWKLITFFTLLGLLLGYIYLATAVPLYTATTRLLIDTPETRTAQDVSGVAEGVFESGEIDSQVELIRSEAIAAQVVDALDLVDSRVFRSQRQSPGAIVIGWLRTGSHHIATQVDNLLAFGAPVARRMGAEYALQSFAALCAAGVFLTFYLLSGAVGALTFTLFHMNETTLLVGASGGVSGLLGAVVRFAFNRTSLFGPEASRVSPLNSPSVLAWSAFVIVTNIAIGIYGAALTGGASIAWEAHIGGYLFGLLAYPVFERLARAFR